jgi:hypothetical protein
MGPHAVRKSRAARTTRARVCMACLLGLSGTWTQITQNGTDYKADNKGRISYCPPFAGARRTA